MSVGDVEIVKKSFHFKWKIAKFESYLGPRTVDMKISSPKLQRNKTSKYSGQRTLQSEWSFYSNSGHTNTPDYWSLTLHFYNDDSIKAEWISASLDLHNDKKDALQWSLFILNNKREMLLVKKFNIFKSNDYADFHQNFIEKKQLLNSKGEFLPNDTLTIGIELIILDDPSSSDIKYLPNPTKKLIVDDLRELLEQQIMSDVTFLVGDEEFKVHRVILMMRSPVFSAMFSLEMKEKKDNTVTIPNVDPVIFEKVLEFVYTDKVDQLENHADKLLEFADQYQLLVLKELCQDSLCKFITVENVLMMMALADRFNAKHLFDRASDLAATNINFITKTKEYKEIVASDQSTPILSILVEKLAAKIAGHNDSLPPPLENDDDDY